MRSNIIERHEFGHIVFPFLVVMVIITSIIALSLIIEIQKREKYLETHTKDGLHLTFTKETPNGKQN